MSNALISTAVVSTLTIERPAFDVTTAWGIALLAALMAAAWVWLLARRHRRYGVAAAVVLGVVLVANVAGDQLGWFSRLDILPPPFVVMNFAILAWVLAVGLGYTGHIGPALLRSVQVETLVALQIFRLPLELLMLRAAYLQIMPVELSMLGYNLDVLTGLGALLISAYCAWTWSLPLKAIWLWNVLGMACLAVIALLAVLTSPTVHAFGAAPEHVNSWVLYFPYSLLPSVLVGFAVLGHVLLTRKLLVEHPLHVPKPRWLAWPLSPKATRDMW
jgi:hypothetical protein